ncbi:MAG: 2-oxoacid:acceptor oxidoreductase family protein [Oscillospiraceae bacterium]|nr:2-oxoacid:acceptor oxidoreductase family protein [Oscillospiraceae bacterium]
MTELIIAGFGGQGVSVAGFILAEAAMGLGWTVTWFPSYGAEMRGGTANSHVKIADGEIASPYVTKPDYLIILNETSLDKFEKRLKPGGMLVINTSLVRTGRGYRKDIKFARLPATEIAIGFNNAKGANIAMLGAFCAVSRIFEPEYLRNAVDSHFAGKGKHNPKNALCFNAGFESGMVIYEHMQTAEA